MNQNFIDSQVVFDKSQKSSNSKMSSIYQESLQSTRKAQGNEPSRKEQLLVEMELKSGINRIERQKRTKEEREQEERRRIQQDILGQIMGAKKQPEIQVAAVDESQATPIAVKQYLPKQARPGSRSPRRSRRERQLEREDVVADDLPLSRRE